VRGISFFVYSNNSSKCSSDDDQRTKEAAEQASLVGAKIGQDMKAIAVQNSVNNKIKMG